jgi:hypothetical protein
LGQTLKVGFCLWHPSLFCQAQAVLGVFAALARVPWHTPNSTRRSPACQSTGLPHGGANVRTQHRSRGEETACRCHRIKPGAAGEGSGQSAWGAEAPRKSPAKMGGFLHRTTQRQGGVGCQSTARERYPGSCRSQGQPSIGSPLN